MTPNAAPSQSARPHRGHTVAERRRSPGAFRGSLERRLPGSALMAEAECLLPPVGRSEAFAEDLAQDSDASTPAAGLARRLPRLRWLGLPVLALGVGVSLSLVSFSGMARLAGF